MSALGAVQLKLIRRLMIFLLFFALFATFAIILFGAQLGNWAVNVRTGMGLPEYSIVAQGMDGKIYALGYWDDMRIVCLSEESREYDRKIMSGLPDRFEAVDMHISESGAFYLTVYEYEDGSDAYCGLYYSEDGREFQLLFREKLDGNGTVLSTVSEYDGMLRFFARSGKLYTRYCIYPEDMAVLVNDGIFAYHGDMIAGIVTKNGETYIAGGNGELVWINSLNNQVGKLQSERLYARLMQQENGFAYIDGRSATLITFDSDAKIETALFDAAALPCPAEAVSRISPAPDGTALILQDYTRLYSLSPGGGIVDLTRFLYEQPWKSALILVSIILAAAIFAYCFYYLFTQIRKMYFPTPLRGFLTAGLLALILLVSAFEYSVKPGYIENMREPLFSVLSFYCYRIAHDGYDMRNAEEMLSAAGFEAIEILILDSSSQELQVLFSTETLHSEGFLLGGPEAYGRLLDVDSGGGSLAQLNISIKAGRALYAAYEENAGLGVLIAADGSASEHRIRDFISKLTLLIYALSLSVALCSAFVLWSVSRKARHITAGVDRLASGIYDKPVNVSEGDEFHSLAQRLNSLGELLQKQTISDDLRNNSFLQYVPQQLVSLMGVSRIEEIDKSTTNSREMAMIVVWFSTPGDDTLSDPVMLFQNINEVIGRTSGIVSKYGGTIYDFTYDGYSAVFPDGPAAAVSAAVEIRQGIVALNKTRESQGSGPVVLRVAIAQGNVMLGVVGDDSRTVPTAVSSGLSTARMLIRLASLLDANILCTMEVADEAKSYFVRYIGKTIEKDESIRVYEIIDGDEHKMRTGKEEMHDQFASGLYSLYGRDFTAAKRIFMDLARNYGEDGVMRYYLYLADRYEKEAPDEVGIEL